LAPIGPVRGLLGIKEVSSGLAFFQFSRISHYHRNALPQTSKVLGKNQ
jgi:hypothetical protein